MRTTPGRRRVLPAAVLAVAVLVVALGACSSAPAPRASAPASGAVPAVAAGWQRFSSLGLEVDAPADWPFNVWHGCSAPPPAQIERGEGAVAGCGSSAVLPEQLSVSTRPPEPDPGTAAPTRPSTTTTRPLGPGTTATVRRSRTADGRYAGSLDVGGRHVHLEVSSPDETVVDRVLASVRAVDVDTLGCVTQLPAEPPSWDRPAAGPAVRLTVAGPPTAMSVCHYQRVAAPGEPSDLQDPGPAVLSASALLTGQQLLDAVSSLERAGAGALPAVPRTQCLRTPESSPLWLHVHYRDAADVDVHVQYSSCDQRYSATPTGVSQVTEAQLKALLGPLSTGYGYSAPLPAG